MNDRFLHGKKILFLSPAFFGYEKKIKDKMELLGAEVDYFNERGIDSNIEKALLKIIPGLFSIKANQYFQKIINDYKTKDYTNIFIIKGDVISKKILMDLKRAFPNAQLYLYLYDSMKNVSGIERKIPCFDKCYSFDREDCNKNSRLNFQPLFFCDDYRKKTAAASDNEQYDISFVGTIHSDRYAVVKKISKICSEKKWKAYWYLHLPSRYLFYFFKFTKKEFKNARLKEFCEKKLDSKNISSIVENSKIILDIQDPKQSGLTMRTIEMIGMKKKLVTTNRDIQNYNFYCPENICIIDRDSPEIPDEFVCAKYHDFDSDIYEEYSIDNWLRRIFNG